jgi:DNA-binding transcriptional regulator YhcF (GntR family)
VTIYRIVIMTNWLPSLDTGTGPLYVRIADEAENAIKSGALPNGAKLPPQRDLAYDVGVTIGTISRAYALLRERGLVAGEVGRGTYVQGNDDSGATQPRDPVSINYGGTRAIIRARFRATPEPFPPIGWKLAGNGCLQAVGHQTPIRSCRSLASMRASMPLWLPSAVLATGSSASI